MIAPTASLGPPSWTRTWTIAAALVALAVSACTNPITAHKAWDDYAGETLKVYRQDPATAGQVVWRALKEQRGIGDFLDRQGEPDSLEIRGGKFSRKTIILYYTRRTMGPPHSIRLDPAKDGFTPRAPEPLATVQKAPGSPGTKKGPSRTRGKSPRPEASPDADAPDAAPKAATKPTPRAGADTDAPSAEQRVTCPVDPMRADCRALCTVGDYDWCR